MRAFVQYNNGQREGRTVGIQEGSGEGGKKPTAVPDASRRERKLRRACELKVYSWQINNN